MCARLAALRRKGKDEGLTDDSEGDMPGVMEHVVHTHNTMNEMTWQRVQNWERLHPESRECKLNRFLGRPDELSPLARLRALINGQRPFDRHDWYVLRDGKEVRYVIDFYFAEERAGYPDVRRRFRTRRVSCASPLSPGSSFPPTPLPFIEAPR